MHGMYRYVFHSAYQWIFICTLTGLAACGPASEPDRNTAGETPRPVKIMQITAPTGTRTISFPGISKASREVRLSFRVSGPVQKLPVKIGQYVKQGDLIARIDPRDYQLKIQRLASALDEAGAKLKAMRRGARTEDIASLKAEIAAAEAQKTEAKLMFHRYRNLYREKAVAKARFDNVKASYDAAAARVEALSQQLQKARKGERSENIEAMESRISGLNTQLKEARNALADTRLTAPFSGYIARKLIENFETVQAGRPIVVLQDVSRMDVTVGIPEELTRFESGFRNFICEFDTWPDKHFKADLKELGKTPRLSNQTYPMTVTIRPAQNTAGIRPGMAASLTFEAPSDAQPPGFLIPVEAVVSAIDGNHFVWTYDPDSCTVRKKAVTVGALTSGGIRVIQGLEPRDRVVIAGANYLRPDESVRPIGSVTGSHEGGRS